MQTTEAHQRLAVIRQLPQPLPSAERATLGIQQVRPGGVLRIDGMTLSVTNRHRYRDDEHTEWFELMLEDVTTGAVYFLEIEEDDEVTLLFGQKFSRNRRAIGGLSDAIAQIDELDDDADGNDIFVTTEGHTFWYDDDEELTFFKDDGDDGETFYLYNFKTEDEQHSLSVEVWGSKQEISIGRALPLTGVEILHPGTSSDTTN